MNIYPKVDSKFSLLVRLWSQIETKRRVYLLGICVLILISAMTELVTIGSILPFLGALTAPEEVFKSEKLRYLIELLNIKESGELLLPLTLLFVVAAAFSGVCRFFLVWGQTRLNFSIAADLGVEIYRRTLYQPYSVHASRNSSEVISGVVTKSNNIVGYILNPVLTIITSGVLIVTLMFFLVMIDPYVAIGSFFGFGGLYFLVSVISRKRINLYARELNDKQTKVVKSLQEGLGGIRDVLLDGVQDIYCEAFRKSDTPLRKSTALIAIWGAAPKYIIEALGMIFISFLSYVLVVNGSGKSDIIPTLGALAIGAQRMLPLLQQGYQSLISFRGGHEFLIDVLDLLEQPLPSYASVNSQSKMAFQETIELRDLSFSYGEGGQRVLSGLNLIIPKGARIGFVGSTGSGKSTLLDVLMGLQSPWGGGLFIDGSKIDEENRRGWQGRIAHVPQVIFMSDSTIRENIAFGVPLDKIDDDKVKRVAELAQISETIENLSEGYFADVGERGVRLSGGQRQRLGIARALYKDADVIIFDEATSALDSLTESKVMDAINSLDSEITMIIVAHRVSTLKGCDFVVELEAGKIVRKGSYDLFVNKAESVDHHI